MIANVLQKTLPWMFLFAGTATAGLITYPLPTPAYLSRTAKIPITQPDDSIVSSITDGVQTVTFTDPTIAKTVDTSWFTWGSPPDTESDFPRVLWTGAANTTLAMSLARPALIFGFEAEPGFFDVFPIEAAFYSGPTLLGTIVRDVDGFFGARLFAGETTEPSQLITDVVVSSSYDFAIAQVRYAPVPEPETVWLVACVASILWFRRRARFT
jgi:hypothetical protein